MKNHTLLRLKRKLFARHIVLLRVTLALLLLAFFILIFRALFKQYKSTGLSQNIGLINVFLNTPDSAIKKTNSRTNILLLGKAGEGNPAPDLTDTMMVFSVSTKTPQITIVSIPRDIWIDELRTKINSVYYWGNKKQENGGVVLAKSTVSEVLGLDIHYTAVVDYSAFTNLIDAIGGIDVEIENSFTDKLFPIQGKEDDLCGNDKTYACRYETVKFEKGVEHMDGQRALKFVRSRHSEDKIEGNDIARNKRQQKVIDALSTKLASPEVFASPAKINEIIAIALEKTQTDMDINALAYIARKTLDARVNPIKNISIPEELLENPPLGLNKYDGLYVFVPKKGTWSEVQNWVNSQLTN